MTTAELIERLNNASGCLDPDTAYYLCSEAADRLEAIVKAWDVMSALNTGNLICDYDGPTDEFDVATESLRNAILGTDPIAALAEIECRPNDRGSCK